MSLVLMKREHNIVCTTVNEDLSFNLFSRARYLVLVKNGVVVHKEVNPALNSTNKRPTVARRCVELGATIVLAPHGSLCYPSYLILRRSGVDVYVVRPGDKINSDPDNNYYKVSIWEVMYSSFLAIKERIEEAIFHG
ncbi:hypothetical protein VMUT_0346 [Vulcanisaeta moutnovskia 768-28]|uniref:Uncharacterized protein n=1 Tax=Vulcanisaeta moutnovskia (strain 768-28) TaxID=985053 RepID=F0QTU3_VULM7|nr:NifB/NifX family molybdenum-iron cluster-binding protein [Vulcanisaeta moutnovskia]ADY00559.1 hypothetical protein VMUT_0346 [Vulcanisaeta moutnovskia 768-28]